MVCTLIVGMALLAAEPPEQARPAPVPAPIPEAADPVARAEYDARRAEAPDTADGHWKLGLWCEQRGLATEARFEFMTVTRIEPGRDAAWKKLGYQKSRGRWVLAEEVAAARAEADAQRKADAKWRPLMRKWKAWLDQKSRRAEAERALAEVEDPRAVPAIWWAFAEGGPDDQERAIDVLGHIEGERSSQALAALAISGKTARLRRAAVETLMRRDPDDVLAHWIGQLRDPIKYEVRQVAGAGSEGFLLVEGQRFDFRRSYLPPPAERAGGKFFGFAGPEDVDTSPKFYPLQFSSRPYDQPPPGSKAVGSIGGVTLYVHDFSWSPPNPTPNLPEPTLKYQHFERAQLQAQANRDFQLGEAAKMAAGAQARLEQDVGAIEASNANIRETNARLTEALRRVAGKDLGEGRESWLKWLMERRGYAYIPPEERPKAIVDVQVPLPYVPASGPPVFIEGGEAGGSKSKFCMLWQRYESGRTQSGVCFAAGTAVQTPDGPRPIETLRAGDGIMTADGSDQEARPGTILSVERSEAVGTLRLVLDGEEIVTTAGHPFWRPGRGWTPAGDLRPHDEVLGRGGPARVGAVESREAATVWNLTVADGSAYFVGRLGLLVHDFSPVVDAGRDIESAGR